MNVHLQAWNRDYSVYSKIQNIKLKCKLQTGKYFKYLWQSLYVTNTKKDLHNEKKERNNSNDHRQKDNIVLFCLAVLYLTF